MFDTFCTSMIVRVGLRRADWIVASTYLAKNARAPKYSVAWRIVCRSCFGLGDARPTAQNLAISRFPRVSEWYA